MDSRVEAIKAQVRLIWGAVLHTKGVWGAIKTILSVSPMVEAIAATLSGMTGAVKRQAVIDLISDAVKLPLWLSPFKRTLIGVLIDTVIAAWNALVGHDWITRYMAEHAVFSLVAPRRVGP